MQKSFGIVLIVAFVGTALAGSYCYQKLTDAQNAFNQALGVTSTLDWSNVDSLWNFVVIHYTTDAPYGFRRVCAANKQYKNVLMNDYIRCTQVIELIRDDNGLATNVTLTNALNYFGLIASFDFTCGAGFGIYANNGDCVSGVFNSSNEDLLRCRNNLAFLLTQGSPLMQCDYVAQYLNCTRTPFQKCGNMGDYWGCEFARTPSVAMFPQCLSASTNCLVTNYGS